MIKKMTFCEKCRIDVTYHTEKKITFFRLHSLLPKYGISKDECYCDVCGNEVYVSEVADRNIRHTQSLSDKVVQLRPKLDLIEARLKELGISEEQFFANLSLVGISPMDIFDYMEINEYIENVVQKQLNLVDWKRPISLTEDAQNSVDQKMFENLIVDFQFLNSLIDEVEKGED